MNPFQLLFGFSGRINRAKLWLAVLIHALFLFTVVASLMVATPSLDTLFDVTLIAYVPLIVSAVAVGIKRLHDRNKSGWWLLLFYALPFALDLASYHAFGDSEATGWSSQLVLSAGTFVSTAIKIWALIELGCLRGSIGMNPYGGDPLAPQPAPPRIMVR